MTVVGRPLFPYHCGVGNYQLGIDYGTSNVAAVLRWPDGRLRPLLFDGSPLLPSAVFVDDDGRMVTGRDAVRRAKLYLEAGADAIFPEAMEGADEFAAFAKAVPAPLLANMTEFGKSELLDFPRLAAMGYRMVLYPVTALRAALRAAQETLAELREVGHQRQRLSGMLTRAELYELLGYRGYEERDRAYFS